MSAGARPKPSPALMRVVHLGPDPRRAGGMAAVIRGQLASPLSREFSQHAIATYRPQAAWRRHLLFLLALVRLTAWSLRPGPGVVHIHTAVRGSLYRKALLVALARRVLRRPVVLQVHAGAGDIAAFDERLGPLRRALLSRAFTWSNRVLSVSAAGAAEVERRFGARDVLVVRNAAPTVSTQAADASSPASAPRILYLGGFDDPAKGGTVLVDALEPLLATLPDVVVDLAGPGDAPDRLRTLARGDERVHWLGWLDPPAVADAYRRADIVAFPSLTEGLPVALLEAMSHGCAIVAARAGGMPEVLDHGSHAVLVNVGDSAALATALMRLATDSGERRRLGAAARTRAQRLNADDVYAPLRRIYGELATGNGGGPLRVLLVTPTIGPGGAETQLVDLAAGLARRGHRVRIACVLAARRDTSALAELGVEVVELHRTRPAARPLAVPRLASLARQADVVCCTMWDASLWGRLGAMVGRRPVLVIEHSGDRRFELAASGASRGRWIALHNRLLARFTYATVAIGGFQLPILHSEGIPAERILLIPNGIPIDEVRAAAASGVTRDTLGLPADALVVVHPARFHPVKNQPFTYEVVRRLRQELGDVRAVFVGGGQGCAELEQRARDDGADWAHFLGTRPDMPALLQLADLAVLPSLAEGMPMALIEALALGVPTVAAAVGEIPRVLAETGGGVAVPAGDLNAFAQACRDLLADAALRAAMSDRARASRTFDVERMVDRYAAVFEAAALGRAPAGLVPG